MVNVSSLFCSQSTTNLALDIKRAMHNKLSIKFESNKTGNCGEMNLKVGNFTMNVQYGLLHLIAAHT